MVQDRLVAREALEAHDLLGQQRAVVPELDVPLSGDVPAALIGRHTEEDKEGPSFGCPRTGAALRGNSREGLRHPPDQREGAAHSLLFVPPPRRRRARNRSRSRARSVVPGACVSRLGIWLQRSETRGANGFPAGLQKPGQAGSSRVFPHAQARACPPGVCRRPAAQADRAEARSHYLRQGGSGPRRRSGPSAAGLLAVALLAPLHGDERGNDQRLAPASTHRPGSRSHALRGLPGSPLESIDGHALRPACPRRPILVSRGLLRSRPARRDPREPLGPHAAQPRELRAQGRHQLARAPRLHGRRDRCGGPGCRLLGLPGRLHRRPAWHWSRPLTSLPGLSGLRHQRRRNRDSLRSDLLRRHAVGRALRRQHLHPRKRAHPRPAGPLRLRPFRRLEPGSVPLRRQLGHDELERTGRPLSRLGKVEARLARLLAAHMSWRPG